ncbi:MAG: hypothetical protein E7E73_03310 [Negativicoccus succinicivorans]|nr:hypothetical protein [Negativicoccus succinicivorans]
MMVIDKDYILSFIINAMALYHAYPFLGTIKGLSRTRQNTTVWKIQRDRKVLKNA